MRNTIPQPPFTLRLLLKRPMMGFSAGTSAFFFGGILIEKLRSTNGDGEDDDGLELLRLGLLFFLLRSL